MIADLIDALAHTGYKFAHYAWSKPPADTYGTYSEEDENNLKADNRAAEKVLRVYINLFTKDDSGTPRTTIEAILDGGLYAWVLNTMQFEADTGYIHYEWICEVAG